MDNDKIWFEIDIERLGVAVSVQHTINIVRFPDMTSSVESRFENYIFLQSHNFHIITKSWLCNFFG